MRSYETNEDHLQSILNFDNKPEVIPADIENNSILGQDVCTAEKHLDICWSAPFRPRRQSVPIIQRLPDLGMPVAKFS